VAAPDIFDDSLVRPQPAGVARIGRPVEPREPPRLDRFARIGSARVVATSVLALGGAIAFRFPLWAAVVFPAAAVGVQCIARPVGARWALWSVVLAAYVAEATLPFTWGGRFVALLLFFAPFVSYLGSVLRGLPEP
jgi:hypothetical protein